MTDSKTGLKLTKHTLKSGKIIYISDKCHLTGTRAVKQTKMDFGSGEGSKANLNIQNFYKYLNLKQVNMKLKH